MLTSDQTLWLHDDSTGLWFRWRGSHTVNVYDRPFGQELDCFEFGHDGVTKLTCAQFVEHVQDYLECHAWRIWEEYPTYDPF